MRTYVQQLYNKIPIKNEIKTKYIRICEKKLNLCMNYVLYILLLNKGKRNCPNDVC